MEHSFWKRILLLRKTLIAQSSSSSSAIFDGGESHTQIAQNGLTEKLNVTGDSSDAKDANSNDYSDYLSTASLASSSSSSITRCDFSDKKYGCSGRTLWVSCALIIVILTVVLALILTITLMSTTVPLSVQSAVNTLNSTEEALLLASDSSFEVTDGSSNNNNNVDSSNKFDSSSVNYVDTLYTEQRRNGNNEGRSRLTIANGSDGVGRTTGLLNTTGSRRVVSSQQPKLSKEDRKKISRQSWEFLNRKPSSQKPNSNFINKNKHNNRNSDAGKAGAFLNNNAEDEDTLSSDGGVVLPALMVYTSDGEASNGQISNLFSLKKNNMSKKSCCRTQKYMQTVNLDGCEPLKIVNRMCSGQCVSVWIPGVFYSFPVCQPSISHWKVVTLKCGPHRDKKKRVRIEKIRRCSCIEGIPSPN